jgi:hypothetical protein
MLRRFVLALLSESDDVLSTSVTTVEELDEVDESSVGVEFSTGRVLIVVSGAAVVELLDEVDDVSPSEYWNCLVGSKYR